MRRRLLALLGDRRAATSSLLPSAALCFLLALAVRLLYVVDLAPTLYSSEQPGTRMAARYQDAALAILDGDGILYPRAWPPPSDTGLLSRPPGYPAFVAAVYRHVGRSYFDVQLAQALLTSLLPPALLLLVARLVGRGPGLAAGAVSAVSRPSAITPSWSPRTAWPASSACSSSWPCGSAIDADPGPARSPAHSPASPRGCARTSCSSPSSWPSFSP